ncbi:MAG: hypothetical protein GY822_13065 [Deltaproteobacteria bacterium]|nr:hypothetical protein [Deltaproteobacteria bacterium]
MTPELLEKLAKARELALAAKRKEKEGGDEAKLANMEKKLAKMKTKVGKSPNPEPEPAELKESKEEVDSPLEEVEKVDNIQLKVKPKKKAKKPVVIIRESDEESSDDQQVIYIKSKKKSKPRRDQTPYREREAVTPETAPEPCRESAPHAQCEPSPEPYRPSISAADIMRGGFTTG